MNRRQQGQVLVLLTAVVAILLAYLWLAPPRLGSQALRGVALMSAMPELSPVERERLMGWLGIDTGFALVYTVFFTWGLRWLAKDTCRSLDVAGRALSWVTALAISFDLTENAILWSAATTGSQSGSPWMTWLASLKYLSTCIAVIYLVVWLICRFRGRRSRISMDGRLHDAET